MPLKKSVSVSVPYQRQRSLARTMCRDVIAGKVKSSLDGVIPSHVVHIVHKAPLRDVATLRRCKWQLVAGTHGIQRISAEADLSGLNSKGSSLVRVLEYRAVPLTGGVERICRVYAEVMHPLQLTFVLRLIAGDVEERSQRVSVSSLHSVIGAEVDECSVIGAKVLVETSGHQPFVRVSSYGGVVMEGAGVAGAESESTGEVARIHHSAACWWRYWSRAHGCKC